LSTGTRRPLAVVAAAPVPAGEVAELVEVPLAQTGEGIAECELLRWFVTEVSLMPLPLVVLCLSPCNACLVASSKNCALGNRAILLPIGVPRAVPTTSAAVSTGIWH
jgi:hypothetical protein